MIFTKNISIQNEIIKSIIAILLSSLISYIIHITFHVPFTRVKLILSLTIPTLVLPFFIIPAYIQKKIVFQTKQELKQSLEEKTELVREVQHRVKNNLSIILSLLHLQKQSPRCRNNFSILNFERRVQTISLAHEHILNSPNYSSLELSEFIQAQKDNIIMFVDNPYRQIEYNLVPDIVRIKLANAVPIGLIISELFINSLQHAFDGRDEGKISIRIIESDSDTILTFEDDGIGISEKTIRDHSKTIGLTLISILVDQIKGKFDFQNNSGTKFTLRFKN